VTFSWAVTTAFPDSFPSIVLAKNHVGDPRLGRRQVVHSERSAASAPHAHALYLEAMTESEASKFHSFSARGRESEQNHGSGGPALIAIELRVNGSPHSRQRSSMLIGTA
jgi:hypothetical protein